MEMQDLAGMLAEELNQAQRTELDSNQALALEYYDGVVGAVPVGWSDLVSTDVRDAVESTVSELMASIAFDEPLAYFGASSGEDMQRAEMETWAVHQAIFGSNRGAVLIEQAIRDAGLQRYGIIKVYVREEESEETREFLSLEPVALAALMMNDSEAHQTSIDTMQQNADGTVDATVTITDRVRRLELTNVAPENFRWSADLKSPFLSDARFFAERCWYTRAQLADMGAKGAATVPQDQSSDQVQAARYPDDVGNDTAARETDESIECWWCYMRDNARGGYESHLFVSPSSVMLSEWVPFHPYASGVTTLRPHRFDGVSIFDRIAPIQKAKTYLLRQLATQARLANQVRLVVRDRGVNPDDVVSDALNPVIRVNGAPGEVVMPLPVLDVSSQILATLQWIDGLRRESGGASIDMTSPQLQIAGQSAHAAERDYSFREMGTTAMLRTIGATLIRSLYLLVHATIKAEMSEPVKVRRGREMEDSDPQHWPQRQDVMVDIGQPLGVRQRRIGALMQTIQMQTQTLMQGGAGLLVSLADIYRAQVALAKMAGLKDAERYWTDPESPAAQQQAQAQQQAAQQQAAQQAAQQQQIIDATKEVETLKSETEILKQRLSDATKLASQRMTVQQQYFSDILDAQSGVVQNEAAIELAEQDAGVSDARIN